MRRHLTLVPAPLPTTPSDVVVTNLNPRCADVTYHDVLNYSFEVTVEHPFGLVTMNQEGGHQAYHECMKGDGVEDINDITVEVD